MLKKTSSWNTVGPAKPIKLFFQIMIWCIFKFNVVLKSFLRQGLSEPEFYGDLVYKLKKIVGSNNFPAQFIEIISHYKKIGYNIEVNKCNRKHVWWSTQSWLATLLSSKIARRWVRPQTQWRFLLKDLSIDERVKDWCWVYARAHQGLTTCWISLTPVCSCMYMYCWVLICFISFSYLDLYVLGDDTSIS